jgi:hypothetical protein
MWVGGLLQPSSDGPDKGLSLLNPLKESGWWKMKDNISPKKDMIFSTFLLICVHVI